MNRVGFATFLTPDDRFLSQKYAIRYVTSGRDLLREARSSNGGPMSIYADPDFSGQGGSGTDSAEGRTRAGINLSQSNQRLDSPHPGPLPKEREPCAGAPAISHDSALVPPPSAVPPLPEGEGRGEGKGTIPRPLVPITPETPPGPRSGAPSGPGDSMREIERRDFGALHLFPLPGTARESAALAEKAKGWNWPAEIYLAGEATKARLKATHAPLILHLATHGFFLPEEEPKQRFMDEWMSG